MNENLVTISQTISYIYKLANKLPFLVQRVQKHVCMLQNHHELKHVLSKLLFSITSVDTINDEVIKFVSFC